MSGADRHTEPTPPAAVTRGAFAMDALSAEVAALQPGMAVGPYRLLRPLGRGGMGTVWLAEQTHPLQREVAVKLLARALDDHLAEACFLVERQALARLVHPCIAQIYDAGQLPGGALFFALEYVDGRTLDAYVTERQPSQIQLIELYERICDGVHHAHQRGLIHRDLKPANLLVREEGAQALPKIIDFGIAIGIAVGQPVRIDARSAVGTLAYMAPEQAHPGDEGIDARVDVYALGATLGKMLGLRQGLNLEGHEVHALYAASLSNTPGDTSLATATVRRLRQMPIELRTIVVKATEADRAARYDSAAALGADLGNWRFGRRVVAMGDSVGYAVRHLLQRYRLASIAVGLIASALLIGSAVAWYGLAQARIARDLAEQRRVQAEELVGAMLGDLANRLRPLGRLDLLETVASEAMRYLSAASGGGTVGAVQRARALRTLGEVHNGRQRWADAHAAFAEAKATLIAATASDAAWLFEAAQIAYFQGYLAYRQADHSNAETHWRDYLKHAKALQALSKDTGLQETSYALTNLGVLSAEAGRLDEAIARYEQAIALKLQVRRLRPQDQTLATDLAGNYSWMGNAQELLGQPRAALASFERQRRLTEQTLRAKPDEAQWSVLHGTGLHVSALLQDALGLPTARATLAEAVRWLSAANSVDPSNKQWQRSLASALSDLGLIDALAGDLTGAIAALTSALEHAKALVGDAMDARTALTLMRAHNRLATALLASGEHAAARTQSQLALASLEPLPPARRIERGEAAHVYWVAARLAQLGDDSALSASYHQQAKEIVAAIDPSSKRYLDLEARTLARLMATATETHAPALESLQSLGYDSTRVHRLLRIYQGNP